MPAARTTSDHHRIRKWVEERGGWPSKVKNTGILRVDFPGYRGQSTLERISWEEFFDIFDKNHLAFLYQDHLESGDVSRFFKFVDREKEEKSKD